MVMEKFIKVSNNLVFASKEELNVGVKPLVDTMDYRVAYVMSYISAREIQFFGYSVFTLEELITSCGLKPNANKGKSNDIFKSILIRLIELNIIEELDNSITKGSAKSNIKCRFVNEQKEGWFKVEPNEFNAIMNYKGSKIDNIKLYNVFSILKSTINSSVNYSFITKGQIMECLGMAKERLNNYLDILQELGVMFNGWVGDTIENGGIKSRYVYATSEELLDQAIINSRMFYKKKGVALLTKDGKEMDIEEVNEEPQQEDTIVKQEVIKEQPKKATKKKSKSKVSDNVANAVITRTGVDKDKLIGLVKNNKKLNEYFAKYEEEELIKYINWTGNNQDWCEDDKHRINAFISELGKTIAEYEDRQRQQRQLEMRIDSLDLSYFDAPTAPYRRKTKKVEEKQEECVEDILDGLDGLDELDDMFNSDDWNF